MYEIPCQRLSQEQREQAIGRGLRDREEGVKKAAKRLVGKWAEEAGGLVEVRFFAHGVRCGVGADRPSRAVCPNVRRL